MQNSAYRSIISSDSASCNFMSKKTKIIILVFVVVGAILWDNLFNNQNSQASPKASKASVDSAWEILSPTTVPEPSDKALKLASFIWVRMSEVEINEAKKSYGNENMSDIDLIQNLALKIDQNPTAMSMTEAAIQKMSTEESRPVYNNTYETPAVEQPASQPAQNKPINCTSNTLGNYTYTNCY